MGLTAPAVHARVLWPQGAELAQDAHVWLALQILGGAFAEVELCVEGAPRAVQVEARVPAYTPAHPGIPMPPGWTPTPSAALYSVDPGRLNLGASYRLTVRTLAGHDGPPGAGPLVEPYAVRCASKPPRSIQYRSEPVLTLEGSVGPALPSPTASLHVRAAPDADEPQAPLAPATQPQVQHTLSVTTEGPSILSWLAPLPRSQLVQCDTELVHQGAPASVRARVWSLAGELVASLDPER